MTYKFIVCIILTTPALSTVVEEIVSSSGNDEGGCILPPYPEHGNYTTSLAEDVTPGKAHDLFWLEITCDPGYGVVGNNNVICAYGIWSEKMPQCIRFCKLKKHPSVNYTCPVSENDFMFGSRDCDEREPSGTLVRPLCNSPNYYFPGPLPEMKCIDGNWDYVAVCNAATPALSTVVEEIVSSSGNDEGGCILPPYPEHGNYTTSLAEDVTPGKAHDLFWLEITCDPGYGVVGNNNVICAYGIWSEKMPQCIRFCKLKKHPSVNYTCPVSENDFSFGSRDCNEREPSGTLVRPLCNSPNYYFPGPLPEMKCIDGNWDYIAVCNAECGQMPDFIEDVSCAANGYTAYLGQFPWHAGIYKKTTKPYMHICGGSLVSTTVVVSAAHCFWSDVEKKQPAANYAVAVGKLYRPWNEPMDLHVQKSDVKEIKFPPRFQGNSASYQDDIAVIIMTSPFEYTELVQPVCLNFDYEFDKKQLQEDSFGMVAGWGLTEKGVPAPILTVLNLPNVDIEKCISKSPPQFRTYITSDKICAGYENGTALCRGDSGGGFAVPSLDAISESERYYLRGIVSTAPKDDTFCNTFTFTALTHVFRHQHFIKENL